MPRPPGYQRSTVLGRATELFWRRGYGATSVADLVTATGLKPGSLYAAFGSKKGLFLEVLAQYNSGFLDEVDACVAAAPTPLTAIRELLQRMADASLGESGRRGCLAVNALLEMAEHDADIAAAVRTQNETLRARLQTVLETAARSGELGEGRDPQQLATFVLNNFWGIRVLCKTAPNRRSLDAIVEGVMSALGEPAAPGAAGAGVH